MTKREQKKKPPKSTNIPPSAEQAASKQNIDQAMDEDFSHYLKHAAAKRLCEK